MPSRLRPSAGRGSAIGSQFGLTRERVRQLEMQALAELARQFEHPAVRELHADAPAA